MRPKPNAAPARENQMTRASGAAGCIARLVGPRGVRAGWMASTALISVLAFVPQVLANPTGGQVVAGGAVIAQPNATTVKVTQSTERTAIDWQSFSIAKGETTDFVQPNASAVALNRVIAPDPSVIAGTLKANGNLIIVNRSGIVFSKGSQVDVNGLVATTSDIRNSDLMAGNLKFGVAPANPDATVVNDGTITVGQAGLAALVAPGVANGGAINAKLGRVVLAGAKTFAVDLYGDGLVSLDVSSRVQEVPVKIDGKAATALVTNTGEISADGGHIVLTADAAYGIVTDLVNAGGTIQARTVQTKTGTVQVAATGGAASVTGTIDVSGLHAGQTGGLASAAADTVTVASTARIDARGAAGGGTVKIGGGLHGTDKTIANAKTTTIAKGATIDASATVKGDGGTVAVWSDETTRFAGSVSARGGSLGGDGGFVETSGLGALTAVGAVIDLRGTRGALGTWLLDPHNITVATGGSDTPPQTFTENPGADVTVDPGTLKSAAATIDLQANNDITIANSIGQLQAGAGLTLEAGQSILVNAGITTTNGAVILVANQTTAKGVVNANRDAGSAVITMATGTTIDAGTASISITLSTGAGLTNSASGDISLAKLNTTGNVSIANNGPSLGQIQLTDAVNGDTVSLKSGGAITQTGGVITATTLIGSSVGGATVDQANAISNLGAFVNASSGNLSVTNGDTALVVTGNVTNNVGNIALTSANKNGITINAAATLSTTAATGAIDIKADAVSILGGVVAAGSGGSVTVGANTVGNPIDIGTQIVQGDLVLGAASLGKIAAPTLIIGNNSAGLITVNTALSPTAFTAGAGNTPPSGITNLTLVSGASGQTLTAPVTLAAGGVLTLNTSSTAAGVTQGPGAAITTSGAGGLVLLGGGNFTLNETTNSINTLAGTVGILSLKDKAALTINTVGGTGNLSATGNVTLTADSVTTTAATGLVSAAGQTVTLQPLTATLAVNVGGANDPGNDFFLGTATLNTITAASLAIGNSADTGALTVTGVLASAGAADALHNVTNLSLISGGGGIAVSSAVTLATGGVLTLSTLGSVDASAGALTATTLTGSSTGDTTLTAGANAISNVDGFVAGGKFSLVDGTDLTIGTTGLTAGGDVSIVANSIKVNATLDATGFNVLLKSTVGDITEPDPATQGGIILANGLLVESTGAATLAQDNQVTTLAANVGKGIAFYNTLAAGLSVDTVTTGGDTHDGVTAKADSAIVSTHSLVLGKAVDVRVNTVLGQDANNLLLGWGVTNTPGTGYSATDTAARPTLNANILTDGLVVVGVGDFALFNNLSRIGATIFGGGFTYQSSQATTVGAVVSTPYLGGSFGVTVDDDVAIRVTTANNGNLRIDSRVTAQNALLESDGGTVTETSTSGLVKASGLIVRASGDIDMQSANLVSTLAIGGPLEGSTNIAGGGVSFVNAGVLTVGSVSVAAPSLSDSLGSVAATGDVALEAQSLTLAGSVSATNALLDATAGGVSETTGGSVAATGLIVEATADSALNLAANHVTNLAAQVTSGGFVYRDAKGFTVAPASSAVNVQSPSIQMRLSDVTTRGASATDHAIALIAGNGGLTSVANTLTLQGTVTTAGVIDGVASVKSDVALETLAGGNPGGAIVEPEPPASGGALVARSLLIRSAGTVDLEQANLVDTFAASAVKGIAFNDAQALTIPAGMTIKAPSATTVAFTDTIASPSGISAGGDSAIVAQGALTIAGNVTVGANNLLLRTTAGDVVEPEPPGTGGVITVAGLAIDAAGKIDLEEGNLVGTLAAIANGGGITFYNNQALIIGSVATQAPSLNEAAALSGVTATGDSVLASAAGLDISASTAFVGTNNLLLAADVSETLNASNQPILAGNMQATGQLKLGAGTIKAGGLVVMTTGNEVLDPAAFATTAGAISQIGAIIADGGFSYAPGTVARLTVGGFAVNAPSLGLTAAGIQTSGKMSNNAATGSDHDVVLQAQSITLAGDIDTGKSSASPYGNVGLTATTGKVTESGGIVHAAGLTVQAVGDSDLSSTNDLQNGSGAGKVGRFAANITTGGLAFQNLIGFEIASSTQPITASVAGGLSAKLSNVATSGDAALVAGNGGSTEALNTITLLGNVSVTTSHNLLLKTTAGSNPGGDVIEPEPPTAGGVVTAAGLAIDAAGKIDLEQNNLVTTLAAIANGGGIAFYNSQALTVGNVTVNPPPPNTNATTLSGVTAAGDSVLASAADLDISASTVSVGTNNLLLAANVSETLNTSNQPILAGDAQATGQLKLAAGAITAGGLVVMTTGSFTLSSTTETASQIGAIITNGGFSYDGTSPGTRVTIGGFAVNAPSLGLATTGIQTSGNTGNVATTASDHDVVLKAQSIMLAGDIDTGKSSASPYGNVALVATGADVTEGSGIVHAAGLIVQAASASDLSGVNDLRNGNGVGTVGRLAASVTGGLAFQNAIGFAIASSAQPVNASVTAGLSATLFNVATSGDTALVANNGGGTDALNTIALLGNVTIGSNNLLLKTVSGTSPGGDVVESGGAGAIGASGLAVDSAGLIDLQQGDLGATPKNLVTTLAATSVKGAAFYNGQALTVGTVAVTSPALSLDETLIGAGAGGDVALKSAGTLTLQANVTVGNSDNVLLWTTAGDVIEPESPAAAGVITAAGLAIDSAGKIDLEQANALSDPNHRNQIVNSAGSLAALAHSGGIAFYNSFGLNTGVVGTNAPSLNETLTGVTATAASAQTLKPDTAIKSAGTLTLLKDVDAGANSLLLWTTTGDVVEPEPQGTGGVITASGLAIDSAGKIDLEQNNTASSLAPDARGGGIAFYNTQGFSVTTVATSAPSLNELPSLSGVIASGDAALVAGNGGATTALNTIALLNDVNVGVHNLLLKTTLGTNPAGNVTQPEPPTAGGVITASGLAIDAAGLIDLEQANVLFDPSHGNQTVNTAGSLAAVAHGGGIAFYNSLALDIGTVGTTAPSLNETLTGVTATAAASAGNPKPDAALKSAGTLTLLADVDVGANKLLLWTTAGDVMEPEPPNSGGVITASGLAIDSAGLIDLEQMNLVTTLAADAHGGGIAFYDKHGFSVTAVGTVAPSLNETISLSGVSAAGDAALVAGNGGATTGLNSIVLLSDVNVGAHNLLLKTAIGADPAGNVSEPEPPGAGGVITAAGLAIDSAGKIDLEQNNLVTTLAAIANGGGIAFQDNQALTVGDVSTTAPSLNEALSGVTATADSALKSAGTLTLASDVTVGANNLLLWTTVGEIVEPEPGAAGNLTHGTVTASGLAIDSAGLIDLEQNNIVTTLAANAHGGGIAFFDTQGFSVTTVGTAAPSLNETLSGVIAAGDVALVAGNGGTTTVLNGILLVSDVDVGTHNLLLKTTVGPNPAGDVTEPEPPSAGGVITAAGLAIDSAGKIDLEQANALFDSNHRNQTVNTAGSLAAVAHGGGIAFYNSLSLDVGTVGTTAPSLNETLTEVMAAAAASAQNPKPDTALKAAGTLTLLADVDVGANNLLLWTTAGDVAEPEPQNAGGVITASGLAIDSAGLIDLEQNNTVTTLAADARGGGMAFYDAQGFNVTTVGTAAPSLDEALSGVTANGDAALVAGNGGTTTALNSISLLSDVNVGAHNLLLKTTVGTNPVGDVTEPEPPTAGGVITAAGLAIDSAGRIDLEQANALFDPSHRNQIVDTAGSVAAIARGGGIAFYNSLALDVGTVGTTAPSLNETASGVSGTTDTVLKSAGTLTLLAGITVGNASNVLLWTTAGDVVEPEPPTVGGSVTAAGLAIDSAGLVDLEQNNTVTALAALAHGGGIAFRDTQGFSVTTVGTSAPSLNESTSLSGVTAAGDAALVAGNGGTTTALNSIVLLSDVNVGAYNLLLETTIGTNPSGNVTEPELPTAGGSVTAAGLAIDAAGLIDLEQNNTVTTLAANAHGGGIAFYDTQGFNVTTVATSAPSLNEPTSLSGVMAVGDSALVAGNDGATTALNSIALLSDVDVGAHNLLLKTTVGANPAGDVTEPEPGSTGNPVHGTITAAGLAIDSAGKIDLEQNNLVTTLAAIANGGGIAFQDNQALIVGDVSTNAPSLNEALSGVTATADSALKSAGTLTLASDVSVGANNLLLWTTVGEIVEPEPGAAGNPTHGTITASGLAIDSAGPIDLEQNNIVTTLAANAHGGGIAFQDGQALTVGDVSTRAPSLSEALSGVTATADTALKSAGTLTLASDVTVGANNLLLWTTAGDVVEPEPPSAGGVITASGLAIDSAGLIDLEQNNLIASLSANVRGGGIAFYNSQGFGVTTVATAAPSLNEVLSGVSAAGDSALVAGNGGATTALNTITLFGGVTVGAHNLLLKTTIGANPAGDVTEPEPQNAGGAITASGLAIDSAGKIDLEQNNLVITLAAVANGGGIAFHDNQALTAGDVSTNAPSLNEPPLLGVTATGDTALKSAGTLTLASDVNVGARNLLLWTTVGDVVEPKPPGAGGTITALGVAIDSAGLIDLEQNNLVTTLGAHAHGGGIAFYDNQALTVGGISTNAPSLNETVTGIGAAGDSALKATGALTLTNDLGVGPNNLLLQSTGGGVVEAGASIAAQGLIVEATADSSLASTANSISQLAASVTGGGLNYRNSGGFAVDTVTVNAPSLGATLAGVTTGGAGGTDHAITLVAGNGGANAQSNTLTLNAAVDTTGSGSPKSDVALETLTDLGSNPGGSVVEPEPPKAGGAVIAANLLVRSAGAIDLEQTNMADALAATAASGIAFNNGQALNIAAGTTVQAPSAATVSFTDTMTGLNAQGDSAIVAQGSIAVSSNINVGTGNSLLLKTTAGDVTESAGATITASGLAVDSAGLIDLGQANLVTSFAASAANGLGFNDNSAVTITTVKTSAPSLNETVIGVTAGGDVSIASGGALTVANALTSGGNVNLSAQGEILLQANIADAGGATTLTANGGAIQQDTGTIATGSLTGTASGSVTLDDANQIGALGPFTAGGDLTFHDVSPLTAGNLTAAGALAITGDSAVSVTAALHSGGSMGVTAGGNLLVSAPLTATTGDVVLQAPGQAVTVSANIAASQDIVISGRTFLQPVGTTMTFSSVLTLIDVIAGDHYKVATVQQPGVFSLKPVNPIPLPRYNANTTSLASFIQGFAKETSVGLPPLPATPPTITFATFKTGGTTSATTTGTLVLLGNNVKISDTGSIDVGKLAVIASGLSANLNGIIHNNAGQAAASDLQNAQAFFLTAGVPATGNNDFKFNACTIGSPTCVAVPILVPSRPSSIDTFDFVPRAPFDDIEIERLNTGQEDVY